MLNIHSPDYVSLVLVSIFVLCNLGICAISRLHCTFSESGSCMPISRLHTRFMQSWRVCITSAQSQDHAIYVACTTEPTLSFEFPSYMYSVKVRNICKKLLQLRCHHQCRACTQASCTRFQWRSYTRTHKGLGPGNFLSALVTFKVLKSMLSS